MVPLLPWLPLTLGIFWAFPPSVIRYVVLPQFPEFKFFWFYGGVAIIFTAIYCSLVPLVVLVWSATLRPFISYEAQLLVVQGASPPRAPIRRLGESIVRALHRKAN